MFRGHLFLHLAIAGIWASLAASGRAQTLDTVAFGNTGSESAHSLNYTYSAMFTGAFGQAARQLLPKPAIDVYGGEMTFVMAVDPVQQNYFTIKLWGNDTNDPQEWFVLDLNGLELGDRHGTFSGEDPLWFQGVSWATNTFIYRTLALPLPLTRGKTSVTLKIRSLGWISYYDSGSYFGHYQKVMDTPTVGIYRGYTHAGSLVDVTGETQGAVPAFATPRTLENETATLAAVETNVNSQLAGDLNANAAALALAPSDLQFLAQCYDARENLGQGWISYPSGMTKTNLISQVIAGVDAQVTAQSTNSGWVGAQGNPSWGGYFGPMGDAIRILWPQLSNSLSTTVGYGGTFGTTTRQHGWSQGLRASIDSGRYNRQNIGNQSLYNATDIYQANGGLLLVDPTNALYENEARRYVKEASGILQWLGNDQTGGGPTPVYGTPPFGTNWFMCTTKGTSKDGIGFVGDDYGDLGPWVYRLGLIAGDTSIQARGVAMTRARDIFRFPGPDENGYLVMQGTEPIGERNNGLPGHFVYLGRTFNDDFLMAAQGTNAIGTNLLGYFQQEMNDGQLFQMILSQDPTDPYLPLRYATINSFAHTGVNMPMSIGQPDFAWCDEENNVFAAKHGEERIYANLFWRQPNWISALAKVFYLTTNQARLADVLSVDEPFVSGGGTTVLGPTVEQFSYDTPPDNPMNAYNGTPALIALRSDLTNAPPSNRDGGHGTGYTFRFGNWLVGINAAQATNLLGQPGPNYSVQLPSTFTGATDMISGALMSAPVVLAPKTSAVFYLPTNVDPNPPPSRPLFIMAAGANGRNVVSWSPAGGATGYNVKRGSVSGGPYTNIASAVTNTFYTDTGVANGVNYFYVVTATNNIGESGYSPEDSALLPAPQTAGLPAPWADTNFTYAGGSAGVAAGTFTVTSTNGDIWGTNDGCHFVFQPMTGDGIVTAKVLSQTSANTYAKCGVMIRDSLATNPIEASMNLEANAGHAEFDYRTSYGNSMALASGGSGVTLPYWVRLQRSGAVVTGFISPNGTNWTQIGSVTLSGLGYVAYVGLCTSPANASAGQQNTGVFNSVAFPLGASSAPATPAGLVASGGNTSANLSWTSVSNAVSYNLKRGTGSSGPFTNVATGLINPSATDYGLFNGVNYYYVVSAVNDAGESANSSVAGALGSPPPSAPAAVAATATNSQVTVTWTASTNVTGYSVYRSLWNVQDPQFSLVATNVGGTNFTDVSAVNLNAYCYYVTALTNASESQWSVPAAAEPPGVPSPWQSVEIGAPSPAGYAYQSGTNFNFAAGGSDIYLNSDQFHYVYQTIAGNCAIIARVKTLAGADNWTKAGVMIRQSADPASAFADTVVSAANGMVFQERTSNGGGASQPGSASGSAPYWLMLTRTNNVFTASCSADGTNYTAMGSPQSIAMSDPVLVGLPLTSHANGQFSTATFDYVALAGSAPTIPSVPAGLTATSGNGFVSLGWTASTNFPTGYNVKRSTTNGGPYAIVGTSGAAGYVDFAVTNGTNYYYVVSATNAVGESANSSQAAATPNANAGGNVIWSGGVSTNWDVNTTQNWLSNAVASVYQDGYFVRFDDTAAATNVNLMANVLPGGIIVSNNAKTYTFSSVGGFGIQGTTGFTKSGSGTVNFQLMNNSFIGGVTIAGGTIRLNGVGGTRGEFGAGAVTVSNSATLRLEGQGGSGTVYPVYLTNAITLNGGNIFGDDGGQHLTGPVTIGASGAGVYEGYNNKYVYFDGPVSGGGAITNPTPGVAAGPFGYGPVWFTNPTNAYSGTFTLNNGGVGIMDPNGTALANATLNLVGWNSGNLPGPVAFSNNVITLGALTGSLNFPLLTVTNLILGNNNASAVYSGALLGSNGVTKTGSGVQYLLGTNTYNGLTVISNGELVISARHLGNGNFFVGDGATLGMTNSAAQSAAISNLTLGVSGPATLEFFNVSNLAVAPISASNLTLNGTAVIKITGTNYLAAGNTYPLINYSGGFSGGFANFTLQLPPGKAGLLVSNANQIALSMVSAPAAPTNLTATAGDGQVALGWNASTYATGYNVKNSLTNGGAYTVVGTNVSALNFTNTGLTNGTLYYFVVSAVNGAGESTNSIQAGARPTSQSPPPVSFAAGGGQLQLAWPPDHTGWTVQAQTNAPGGGLGTNWVRIANSSNTNALSVPLVSTNGSVFFRLVYP